MSLEVFAEKSIDSSFNNPNQESSMHCRLQNMSASPTGEISPGLKIYSNHRTICDDKTIKIYNQHGQLVFFMYIPTGVQNQIGN